MRQILTYLCRTTFDTFPLETITYPLLCYPLPEGGFIGQLLGTELQAHAEDVKSIKNQLSDHLQRLYKKTGDYPYSEITEPKMRLFELKIRPGYKNETGSYLSAKIVKVPVPIVFGPSEDGHFECHVPFLEQRFYYEDPKQMPTLVQFLVGNALQALSPEALNRLLMTPVPQLEVVHLRVNESRNKKSRDPDTEREYPTLSRLAERYPAPGKKTQNGLPDVAWEMETTVDLLVEKLVGNRTNVLLVGLPGTGKSAVLRAAARKIAGPSAKNAAITFWQLIAQRITASAKYLGEWQEQVETLVEELTLSGSVLWVVDIAQLLQIGGEGPEDSAAAFLAPFLQQGKIQLVGEATPQQLDRMRRLLPGFVDQFQIVPLQELPEKKVFAIMQHFAGFAKQRHKVELTRPALELAYRLLLRYYPYESFPGKALKLLGRCLTEAETQGTARVGAPECLRVFVQQTGLPEVFLRDDLLLEEKTLHDWFAARIIGQDEAVRQICNVVKIYKAGLNNPNRPINVLVFAGPTGVGKTACAQALSEYFFGAGQKKSPLVRIDMNEFQHPGQLGRFIGTGREVGKLVQDIRERPFAVLLLDEVEKADPSIFDALMTVLDEGVLTDHFGRVTHFRNTIIILTTNLGASTRRAIGFDGRNDQNYESALAKHFRPEFVNRIDQVVAFTALNAESIAAITQKELSALAQREGLSKLGVQVAFSERLVARVASVGFDERYGARPLQRAMEDLLTAPLARWLLDHSPNPGDKLFLDLVEDRLLVALKP